MHRYDLYAQQSAIYRFSFCTGRENIGHARGGRAEKATPGCVFGNYEETHNKTITILPNICTSKLAQANLSIVVELQVLSSYYYYSPT